MHDREVGGLFTLENAAGVEAHQAKRLVSAGSVAREFLQQTTKTSIKPIGNPHSATLAKAAIDSSQLGVVQALLEKSNLGCPTIEGEKTR
jgi:hypothetical protein